ncbi:MAG: hemerythrin domain-containing protein [Elusimicrobia bacterium]|nr:hemerythrin domain-containing protein [Elusimicrobiota bacterium]
MTTETLQQTSLIDLLREDHRRLKDLFSEFESGDEETRPGIIREATRLIAAHDRIEKKLLYPTVKEIVGEDGLDLLLRCREAHHIANIVQLELRLMPNGPRRYAKFAKLAEAIRMHMEEEENQLFPMIERADVDWIALGERMLDYKDGGSLEPLNPGAAPIFSTVIALGALAGLAWLAYDAAARKD